MRFLTSPDPAMQRTLRQTLFLVASLGLPAFGQALPSPQGRGPTDGQVFWMLQNLPMESARTIGPIINALLDDTTTAHMRMAPRRPATRADSARAADIVRTMRASLQPYTDVAAAERDGYVRFLPWLEEQKVYHYNSSPSQRTAGAQFDASKPTSLLYRKDAKGKMALMGAMYTAPATATDAELDARLPLGIAFWHQHVNFCARRPTSAELSAHLPDSTLVSHSLRIESAETCAAEGGWFLPQLFGWMAHVNAFDGDGLETVWGAEGRDHMHAHAHH